MFKPEKMEVVAEMKKLFENNNSLFITDYQGLNVADITILRKKMRENKVKYLVAKNTLLRRAAEDAGIDNLMEYFNGPTAIAFTNDDPAVAAKLLYDSFKQKELPRIKVFVVEKQMFAPLEIKRLAELPSKEILLSQLVAAVESPFSSLVGSLDGVFRKLVGTIDALAIKQKNES